jgi:hypothetical protein
MKWPVILLVFGVFSAVATALLATLGQAVANEALARAVANEAEANGEAVANEIDPAPKVGPGIRGIRGCQIAPPG